jgi:hypothetical protein
VIAIIDSELMTVKKSSEFGTAVAMSPEWVIALGSEQTCKALDINQGNLILFQTRRISFAGTGSVYAQNP